MDSDQGKLFVGGISWETTEEKLIEYFSQYGEVLQTVVMFDKITRRPRGFGFVVFSDPSVLDRVLQDKHTVDGRTVEVKRALSREEQQTNARLGNPNTDGGSSGSGGSIRTKKIFVGGLPASLSEDGFREYFETYGNVTDVVIMYDQNTQRPRGFGFISFDSEEAVDRVLHKTFHDLNGKKVEVKRALPKDANPGGGGRGMGGGGYQAYGGSGGNSGNVHDGRMDSSRYMQAQNVGSGFGPYGNSGYGAPSYGYGPTNSGMGYGGYGGYAGPTAAAYGNPSIASSGYAGGPQGGLRGSWGSQAASGYGAMGYGTVASWGGAAGSVGGAAGPGSAPVGHSPSAMGGYGSQGYGYGGGYGGGDGSYGNQAGYGARFGGGPSGGAGGSSGGEMQGNGGYGGYNDDQGNTGYGNAAWRSDQSQVNGPQSAQGGYGSGYGGTQSRQGQQH